MPAVMRPRCREDREDLPSLLTSSLPVVSAEILTFKPFATETIEAAIQYDEDGCRTDLDGLLQYLVNLSKDGLKFTEVTYVVNTFYLGGVIPTKHHGFVLESKQDFMCLDFGRNGIVWDVMELYPELPDDTTFTKRYACSLDPAIVALFCKRTKPFNWFDNNCETWAQSFLEATGLNLDDARRKNFRGNYGGKAVAMEDGLPESCVCHLPPALCMIEEVISPRPSRRVVWT